MSTHPDALPPHPALTTQAGDAASTVCFGAMQFGGTADAAESEAMFDACRAAGINFFDTAFGYTGGRSETLLGRFAAPERERLFIATKCAAPAPSTAANITAQFEQSLQRLDMDYVDLLYLHRWDPDTPLEETFEALAGLVEAGRVRRIGISNFSAWQTMKAAWVAHRFSLSIDALQPMYNLVKRQAEVEILPMAASEGFAVMPYSPLGGGLLTGKYAGGASGRLKENEMYRARYGQDWMHDAAAALADLAADTGTSPATLAVAWVAHNPDVTAPIISARSVEQLKPSLAAMSFEMDEALYAQISALTPKPAPATDRSEEA
ncbi:aldo/keto reductase [Psychromarinibacter sp. C21-152]|uniref:Aldo/keto reductase n=1 Tax=Psychromarinibacter sediminicola TaxID=3033385 RepID=A0AAE3TBE1_9RHOB|nr:aldo/keto reductase [Psychromarinibacter sediminicola]MDF0602590.1 aldo/keto reductase [Psychromarinibacter sediminicola]